MSGNTRQGFPEAMPDYADEAAHRRQLALILNGVMHGRTNNTGTVTLAANSATTTVTDMNIGACSVLLLIPITADAAAGQVWQTYPNTNKNQITLNHANNGQTDRTYAYVVVG